MANNIDDLPSPTKSGIEDLPAPNQASDAQRADLARYDAVGSKLAPTMGSFLKGLSPVPLDNPSQLPEDPAAEGAGSTLAAGALGAPIIKGLGSLVQKAPAIAQEAVKRVIPGSGKMDLIYKLLKGTEEAPKPNTSMYDAFNKLTNQVKK